ncbi:MAG: hypothetical protein HY923_01680 [Elusimicrobia bacterium]|nr:hypothetical protein [Elusimicrobiota bacterium]
MRKIILAVMIAAGPAAAELPASESLRQGCGFDGSSCATPASAVSASGGETDRLIQDAIDENSGLPGELLKKTREGEAKLLQRTIDESPTLTKMFQDAESNRTWRDYYDDRVVDAAVASWGSNMKAGYLKCTAAAYATYKTAPPVVNVVAGGIMWVAGAIAGVGLGLLASAFTGHF